MGVLEGGNAGNVYASFFRPEVCNANCRHVRSY